MGLRWLLRRLGICPNVPNFVYGYDKTNGDYFNLTVSQNETKIVNEIFTLYTTEGFGTTKRRSKTSSQTSV